MKTPRHSYSTAITVYLIVIAVLPVRTLQAQGREAVSTTVISTAIASAATLDHYENLILALRKSDSVIPPQLPVHPVSAMFNREAIIPPQCYTKTEGHYNACYVCHQDSKAGRENVMNDRDLQEAYSFSDLGMTNHWRNLFEDRSERVAKISDAWIQEYVGQDNYSELTPRLEAAGFEGWIPDLTNLHLSADAFDAHGFAKDSSHWVAFNYKPLPSTFWPTNGSTDDVMIRLAERFRTDRDGNYCRDIYAANLAIVEAAIKGVCSIGCLPIDEAAVGRDLDGDGAVGIAHRIANAGGWVGAAEGMSYDSHLYPEGTEFLHTVRYIGVGEDGKITHSTRMKEVRYMRKWKGYAKPIYARRYQLEGFEKEAGNLPGYQNLGARGLDNGNGWAVQGFIEDRKGRLRANTHEETSSCMGCHTSIGSTIDKTFSFARKVDGARGWKYIDLVGMPDAPNKGETTGEIHTYLERVGGGSEFRHNQEMIERWLRSDGTADEQKLAKAGDVYQLITPSPQRALTLNKAYRTIVEDQDYIFGRDATVTPPGNVYIEVDNKTAPRLPADRIFDWNIILDWPQGYLE